MMKLPKHWKLIALGVALVVGFTFIFTPRDPKIAFIKDDIVKDHARFTPGQSIDVAMAMKMVTHAPPRMLNPPAALPPLLLYPPTASDLAKLSGL
jgi:hypothetical protein